MTKLETITAEDLQNRTYEPTHFLVDELIPEGLHILAGAPKIGKSWLALWLCLCISQGQPLWNFATTQGEALYLSLEDSFQRIQTRLFDLTEDAPPTLHFAIMADTLKHGLEQQIEQFLMEHPTTKLVVIDTLQRVRGTGSDSNLYANDYHDIGILKQLADRRQIAILLMVQQKPTLRRRAGNAKKRRLKAQRSPAAAGKILPFGRSQHRIWLVAGAPAPCQMLFAGRSPHPLHTNGGNMRKNKQFSIRIAAQDLETIRRKAAQAHMSQSDYVTACCLGKRIVILDGLKEVLRQQKAIGNNLNQLAVLANMGKVQFANLDTAVQEFAKINTVLREIQEGGAGKSQSSIS